MAARPHAKRWCFTINNPSDEDYWWLNEKGDEEVAKELMDKYKIKYFICQEEVGEEGTFHIQGFVIFHKVMYLTGLKKINKRAHWEITKGSDQQASDYCEKDDTHTGGRWKYGELPKREIKSRDDRLADACDVLDGLKEAYKRPSDIDSCTLMQCGFIPAMNALCADILGPFRPKLKIITLIGVPGSGKSYSIQMCAPKHGRIIYGNNGCWAQNPTSDVMVFEEFNGQIPLQRMLQMLDPYPLALEVKGRMAPAMYETVIITSNTTPDMWYPIKAIEENEPAVLQRKMDSIHALWDRLGFKHGGYTPVRKTGIYVQGTGNIEEDRNLFMRSLCNALDIAEPIEDDEEHPQMPLSAHAAADITDGEDEDDDEVILSSLTRCPSTDLNNHFH